MTARARLLLLAALLMALAFLASLLWTRGFALPEMVRAEVEVHQREQARLWQSLLDQQQAMLTLAADELVEDPWLAHLLKSGSGGLLALRLQEALPRLGRRYGITALEIRNAHGDVIYPPEQARTDAPEPGDPAGDMSARAVGEAFLGFRQDQERNLVLSYSQPLPGGGRVMLTLPIEIPLAGMARNGVAPARPAAIVDLRGQPLALTGPEEGRRALRSLLTEGTATPVSQRLLETPLSDIAERPIGRVVSLLPAETVTAATGRLNLTGLLAGAALFTLLLLVLARAIRAEFAPLEQLIGGVAALAAGQSEIEVPRHPGEDEAGRLSGALQQLRQRALLLTTLEISRERQRRRQERFLRRQLSGLAETLDGKDREALLNDLQRLEREARSVEAQSGGDALAATGGRLEQALLEPRSSGQDDFALLAVAFENLSFRLRDQNADLKELVAELNEALRAKNEFVLLQQELDLARQMQLSILPPDRPEKDGLAAHGMMLPAKEVGGDFYDVFELDDGRLALVVADVSGKGVPAAFFSLITRTLLKAIATAGTPPGSAINRLNDLLCAENEQMMFVTLFFGLLDPGSGRFVFVNAGHNPPLLLRADGQLEWLPVTGDMALAVMEEQDYQVRELRLSPGDLLLLYSDGVTEAHNRENCEFGEERLISSLQRNQETPTWMMPQALANAVQAFEDGASQADDMTILTLGFRRGGREEPGPA